MIFSIHEFFANDIFLQLMVNFLHAIYIYFNERFIKH